MVSVIMSYRNKKVYIAVACVSEWEILRCDSVGCRQRRRAEGIKWQWRTTTQRNAFIVHPSFELFQFAFNYNSLKIN